MITIQKKSNCSGCHACANICPKSCISMQADKEGFLYPVVDHASCIQCGRCQKVCPANGLSPYNNEPKAYACYNKNESIRAASSSGGIFTLLAEYILSCGGVVFGAAFDEQLSVHHIHITDKANLYKLRGSKYVQSCIGDTYKQARSYLEKGNLVLFTGTPCQIGSLLLYLGKDYDNLYTADIICHGAPSPKVWQTYIKHRELQQNSKVDTCSPPSFRAKPKGWLQYFIHIQFQNDTIYHSPFAQDDYMRAFLYNLSLRPSCYDCNFKNLHRRSDITLADFWGVNLLLPEMFDNKGTSLIFVNSAKGKALFEHTAPDIVYKPISMDIAVQKNPSAYKSVDMPRKRKVFMKRVNAKNFSSLTRQCQNNQTLWERAYNKAKRIGKQILRK